MTVLGETILPAKEEKTVAICTGDSRQLQGDCNADGFLGLSDAICLLSFLFRAVPVRLPCDSGAATDPGNLVLFDLDASGSLGLEDAIFVLNFLFRDGLPPRAGLDCQPLAACPNSCLR